MQVSRVFEKFWDHFGPIWSHVHCFNAWREQQGNTVVPCGPMWSHVVPCGPMWSHVVPCGPMWSHVVPCGPMWSHVVPCGPIWSHVYIALTHEGNKLGHFNGSQCSNTRETCTVYTGRKHHCGHNHLLMGQASFFVSELSVFSLWLLNWLQRQYQ